MDRCNRCFSTEPGNELGRCPGCSRFRLGNKFGKQKRRKIDRNCKRLKEKEESIIICVLRDYDKISNRNLEKKIDEILDGGFDFRVIRGDLWIILAKLGFRSSVFWSSEEEMVVRGWRKVGEPNG